MKNKKVTALAMMMTMCMLGNSAVGAGRVFFRTFFSD